METGGGRWQQGPLQMLPSSESKTERLTGSLCDTGSFSADDLTSSAAANTASVSLGDPNLPHGAGLLALTAPGAGPWSATGLGGEL